MAYSSNNPPALLYNSLNAQQPRLWIYKSTHSTTEILASGFFANGYSLGMRVSDFVLSVVSSSSNACIGVCSVAASSGPCTVAVGGLASTST